MTLDTLTSQAFSTFEKRYPSLAFLLSLTPEEGQVGLPESHFEKVDLEGVEVVYLLGLEQGMHFSDYKPWLEEKLERHLIIVEPDVGKLPAFLEMKQAHEVLSHRRAHLRLPLSADRFEVCLQECASEFPLEHIRFIPSSHYKAHHRERVKAYEETLYSHTTQQHALFQEQFYAHLFFRNSLANIKEEKDAFLANRLKGAFEGVPVIICGAGPSLAKDLERIKTLYDKALIISAGSSIAAMSRAGAAFHMAMAIDPNEEEVSRFKENVVFETPLIYVSRLHHDVFNTLGGSFGVLDTPNGGPAVRALKKALKIEGEPLAEGFGLDAMSVTTTALELAVIMGCSPIILTGVDLAYTGGSRYLPGVIEGTGFEEDKGSDRRCSEKLTETTDIFGAPIFTLSKWQMESVAISQFAKAHPQVNFINATMGGIGIEGVENKALSSVSFEYDYDIEGLLDTYRAPLISELGGSIEPLLGGWKQGLSEAVKLCQQALEHLEEGHNKGLEDGKLIYLDITFKELEVFEPFFKESEPAFEKLYGLAQSDAGLIDSVAEKKEEETLFVHNVWQTRAHVARYLLESF